MHMHIGLIVSGVATNDYAHILMTHLKSCLICKLHGHACERPFSGTLTKTLKSIISGSNLTEVVH